MPSWNECPHCGEKVQAPAILHRQCRDREIVSLMSARLAGGRSEPERYDEATLVTGDCLVISDGHAPYHDADWLAHACLDAKRGRIKKCVIGGDWLDAKEISRFPRERRGDDFRDSLTVAIKALEEMAKIFNGGIWIIKGNHELRVERMIHDAVRGRGEMATVLADLEQPERETLAFRDRYVSVLSDWTKRHAPKVAHLIHWLPQSFIEIEGPIGLPRWRVIHQRNGSRNATIEASYHWQKYQQPVIMTHTHLPGIRFAPNGRDVLLNLGSMTREEWHSYTYREPSGYPSWVRSRALIINGRLDWKADSPYMAS